MQLLLASSLLSRPRLGWPESRLLRLICGLDFERVQYELHDSSLLVSRSRCHTWVWFFAYLLLLLLFSVLCSVLLAVTGFRACILVGLAPLALYPSP